MRRIITAAASAAAAVLLAATGCSSGSAGPRYTPSDNPCVNSRLANGTWQQDGTRQLALIGAEMWCSYGAAFDYIADPATGVGPNTSGWDCTAATSAECVGNTTSGDGAPVSSPSPAAAGALTPAQAALETWWTSQVRPDLFNLLQLVGDAQDAIRRGYVTSGDANGCAALLTMAEGTPDVATGSLAAVIDSNPADLAAQQAWAHAVVYWGDAAQACEAGDLGITATLLNQADYYLGTFFRDLPGGALSLPSPAPALPAPATPAPATPAPASPVPPANAGGCPTSGQLMAAWNATPPAARRSWTTLTPSGMADITCWRGWVVADPVMQANGSVIFREQAGRWQLLPATELSRFDSAVCGVPGAPAAWSGPAGPATCS